MGPKAKTNAMSAMTCSFQKPIRSDDFTKCVAASNRATWEADWMKDMSKKLIFKIILAANYMTIQPLLDLGCMRIACMIKGKSPEEIKTILGSDDKAGKGLTQEEEKSALGGRPAHEADAD